MIIFILISTLILFILIFFYKKQILKFIKENKKISLSALLFILIFSFLIIYYNKINQKIDNNNNNNNNNNKNLNYCEDCDLKNFTIESIQIIQNYLNSYQITDFCIKDNLFNFLDEKIYNDLQLIILKNKLSKYNFQQLNLLNTKELSEIYLNLIKFDSEIRQIFDKYICLKLSKNQEFQNKNFINKDEKENEFKKFEIEIDTFIKNEINKIKN